MFSKWWLLWLDRTGQDSEFISDEPHPSEL